MKRILVAACLIFSTAAFAQDQQNNNNDHGQNDCQCIGIGIPVPNNGPSSQKAYGKPLPEKKKAEVNSLWYTYVQIYINALRSQLYIKKEK